MNALIPSFLTLLKACGVTLLTGVLTLASAKPFVNPLLDDPNETVYQVAASPWMLKNGELTDNVDQLLEQIKDSVNHGLNPEAYDLSAIVELQTKLNSSTLSDKRREALLNRFNKMLDKSFFRLAKHLGSSLIRGRSVQDYIFRESPNPNISAMYEHTISGERSIDDVFKYVAPQHKDYTQLQNALRDLLREKKSGIARTQVADSTKNLVVSDRSTIVRDAKLRLIETGDYKVSEGVNDTFDPTFKEAVETFQERHHLSPTGELNAPTIDRMNTSVEEEITKVVVSLERWRWMPRDLGFQRVVANVPDFRLRMYNGDQAIADMAIVVGKRKHRTPLFSETIKHVVAAPTWTVPSSITFSELLPLERRFPGYLERNEYELLKLVNNRYVTVPFSSVQRSEYLSTKFQYTIRQKPGEKNALGKVKILMPNPYAIYFHDTPAKKLFGRDRRAFSHGCVRLSDPQRLASLVMQIGGASPDFTKELLASEETANYNLKNPIEAHIVYFTTFVDAEGKLNFRDDVYRYDERITEVLRQSNSLLSILKRKNAKTVLADIDNINF